MASDEAVRLAVDIGGTFTDSCSSAASRRFTAKVLTTPRRPEEAVLGGTAAALAKRAGLRFADIGVFVHGTTLATNAIIERKGARTALITTEGFRDVLEIADEGRYDQYDLVIERPRRWCRASCASRCPSASTRTARCGWRSTRRRRAVANRQIARREASRPSPIGLPARLRQPGARAAHRRRSSPRTCPGVAMTLGPRGLRPRSANTSAPRRAVANAYVQPLMAGYLGAARAALARARLRLPAAT